MTCAILRSWDVHASFRCVRRMYGQHGKQIHCQQAFAQRGCLYSRRPPRHASRISQHRLYTDFKENLSRRTCHSGRYRGILRRVTHYDYWQDCLRKSILIDSGADLLIYGMGEKPITELLQENERQGGRRRTAL